MWKYIKARHEIAARLGSNCPVILAHISAIVQKLCRAIHLVRGVFDQLEIQPGRFTAIFFFKVIVFAFSIC